MNPNPRAHVSTVLGWQLVSLEHKDIAAAAPMGVSIKILKLTQPSETTPASVVGPKTCLSRYRGRTLSGKRRVLGAAGS